MVKRVSICGITFLFAEEDAFANFKKDVVEALNIEKCPFYVKKDGVKFRHDFC